MKKFKKSINVEGGLLFCGGWNFSKSVSVGPTFIREMRVAHTYLLLQKTCYTLYSPNPIKFMTRSRRLKRDVTR